MDAPQLIKMVDQQAVDLIKGESLHLALGQEAQEIVHQQTHLKEIQEDQVVMIHLGMEEVEAVVRLQQEEVEVLIQLDLEVPVQLQVLMEHQLRDQVVVVEELILLVMWDLEEPVAVEPVEELMAQITLVVVAVVENMVVV